MRISRFVLFITVAFTGWTAVWAAQEAPRSSSSDQIRIPSRPSRCLFSGRQGNQQSEIHFESLRH